MASPTHQNHQSPSQFSKPRPLKLANKFLASVFFLAVIFSCSSLLPLILNFIGFFSCNIDKNYMFLLCNGILVLIAKSSGFIGSAYQEDNLYGEPTIRNGGRPQKVLELSDKKVTVVAGEKVDMKVKEVQETEAKSLVMVGEGENVPLITQDQEGEQGDEIGIIDEYVEEEEEGEEATGLPSAEELNKKCDDFIRRMKEGIKIEAQQQKMVQY